MKDIENRKDIELLVDTFYGTVREDELIGPIFNKVIKDGWAKHIDIMYRFWQTVLLNEHTYRGSPFIPHRELPLQQHHFDRWLYHFYTTVDGLFKGQVADEAKWRAQKMAQMFLVKLYNNSY